MLRPRKQCFCDSSWGVSVLLSSQSSIHLDDCPKKTVFSVVTSAALILFQSEACIFSLVQSAVGMSEMWTPRGLSAEPTQL